MNRTPHVFIIILLVFCASCAGKQGGGVFFWQASPEQRLFDSAEKQYDKGAYNEALALYRDYLTRFPDADQAPAALLKIGMIYVYLDAYDKAVSVFSLVQSQYPETHYAREAGVGKLSIYHKRGEYQQVTVSAGNVLAEPLVREQLIRVNSILGDSYLALKAPLEAYRAYLSAFEAATGKEKKRIIPRLQTAIALMETSDISTEMARLDGHPPSSYLMYQLGVNFMDEGFTGDAVTTFSSFLENYPRHEYAGQAEQFITELEASAITDQHLIGCLLPMTGKYEKFGHQALEGIEYALSEFARSRGNYSIRVLVKDTASDPLTAQQGLYELSEKNVSAVIGPIATAEYVSIQAQELRIPMIVLTQKPGVTEAGEYIFRNFLTPRMQIKAIVDHATRSLDAKHFAILYPDESYGDIYMNLFWDEVMNAGGKVVGVEAYDPDKTDFADPIKKLVGLYYDIPEDLVEQPSEDPLAFNESGYPEIPVMAPDVTDILAPYGAGPWYDELTEMMIITQQAEERKRKEEAGPEPMIDFDAVFIPDSPNKAGLIIPQLLYYDIKDVHLLGTNLWHSDKLIDMARYHIQGAIVPEGFFEQSSAEHVHRFVTGFRYVYGKSPGFIEAVSYDTAMILFDLVSRTDIRFRAQIKNELYAMPPFLGVTGMTVFDSLGEAVKDIYLLKVRGHRFVEITQRENANLPPW